MKLNLYEMQPGESATVEEWKEWALRLRARAIENEGRKQKAQQEATRLRKEIEDQSRAFIFYKAKVAELENTINTIKSSKAYVFAKFIRALRGRSMKAMRRITGRLVS